MDHYRTITDDVARQLRAERVAALESDHFRTRLMIEEAPETFAQHSPTLARLEAAIDLHTAALEPPEPAGEDDDQTGGDDAQGPDEPDAPVGPDGGGEPERNGHVVDLETIPVTQS